MALSSLIFGSFLASLSSLLGWIWFSSFIFSVWRRKFPMGKKSLLCRAALICFWVSLFFAANICDGSEVTIEVIGSGECTDCKKSNIETSHAYKGLRVTIDCKSKDGDRFKTRGSGELDEEGKFEVVLPNGIAAGGRLNEECFAQLHSASATPCPAVNGLESSKVVFMAKTNEKHSFGVREKLKFSPVTCSSAFLWPFFKHPSLPKWPKQPFFGHPLFINLGHPFPFPPKVFPPLPPFPFFKKPLPTSLPFYKKPLPPLPVFKKPLPPPIPLFKKPLPPFIPVYKKPLPPPIPVYKKPLPPPMPVYRKPLPLPPPIPVYKNPLPPPVPEYKKPLPPPVPIFQKPLPPPIPVFKKPLPPPIPVYKPISPIHKPPFKKIFPPHIPIFKKPLPPFIPIYKPKPPIFKPPIILPPPLPVFKKPILPFIPIYKPKHPFFKPIPTWPKIPPFYKKPWPPIPTVPKFHHKFGKFAPIPPFAPHYP